MAGWVREPVDVDGPGRRRWRLLLHTAGIKRKSRRLLPVLQGRATL